MLSAHGDSVISYVIINTHLIMTGSPSQVLIAASQDGVIKETLPLLQIMLLYTQRQTFYVTDQNYCYAAYLQAANTAH